MQCEDCHFKSNDCGFWKVSAARLSRCSDYDPASNYISAEQYFSDVVHSAVSSAVSGNRNADAEFTGNRSAMLENGDTYEGSYEAGKLHGKGVYTYKDGRVFTGWFFSGVMKKGEMKIPGTGIFTGEWSSGTHAAGKMTYTDNRVVTGEMEGSRFLSMYEVAAAAAARNAQEAEDRRKKAAIEAEAESARQAEQAQKRKNRRIASIIFMPFILGLLGFAIFACFTYAPKAGAIIYGGESESSFGLRFLDIIGSGALVFLLVPTAAALIFDESFEDFCKAGLIAGGIAVVGMFILAMGINTQYLFAVPAASLFIAVCSVRTVKGLF